MSPHDKLTPGEALDRALSCLETALEASGELLPSNELMVEVSRPYLTIGEVPEPLRDPMAVLRRGQQVDARGLQLVGPRAPAPEARAEFAMAARNGGQLNEELVRRMHADRSATTARKRK